MIKSYHNYLFMSYVLLALAAGDVSAQIIMDSVTVKVAQGWNLLSLPVAVPDGRKSVLFPSATSNAYTYQNNYVSRDTLVPGIGYWLKFPSAETLTIAGRYLTSDTIHMQSRWNLIGSLAVPVPANAVISVPSNIVASSYSYYQADSGYKTATLLEPGKGYWVKTFQAGTLVQYCWDDPSQVLLSPENKSTGQPQAISLQWRSSQCASSYHVQVGFDSTFQSVVLNDSTVVDTSYQLSNLEYNGDYYWRAGVRSPNGETFWSRASEFEVIWKPREFQGRSVFRMTMSWPYLYVCALQDGLWRRRLDGVDSVWQYLGLADSTGYRHVVDVDVFGSTLLAAMMHYEQYVPYQRIGLWRSSNEGASWAPSDTGISAGSFPYSPLWTVKRSPFDSSIVIASMGTFFRSTDGGHLWGNWDDRGFEALYAGISWHPLRKNEVWLYAQGNTFSSGMGRSLDYGSTLAAIWSSSTFPFGDTPIYSLAFDAVDSNVIYASGDYGVVKTTNSGEDWHQTNSWELPWILDGYFRGIASHPTNSGEAYFSDYQTLFITHDGGSTFKAHRVPIADPVTCLSYCEELDELFIGTWSGIYSYKIHR